MQWFKWVFVKKHPPRCFTPPGYREEKEKIEWGRGKINELMVTSGIKGLSCIGDVKRDKTKYLSQSQNNEIKKSISCMKNHLMHSR